MRRTSTSVCRRRVATEGRVRMEWQSSSVSVLEASTTASAPTKSTSVRHNPACTAPVKMVSTGSTARARQGGRENAVTSTSTSAHQIRANTKLSRASICLTITSASALTDTQVRLHFFLFKFIVLSFRSSSSFCSSLFYFFIPNFISLRLFTSYLIFMIRWLVCF